MPQECTVSQTKGKRMSSGQVLVSRRDLLKSEQTSCSSVTSNVGSQCCSAQEWCHPSLHSSSTVKQGVSSNVNMSVYKSTWSHFSIQNGFEVHALKCHADFIKDGFRYAMFAQDGPRSRVPGDECEGRGRGRGRCALP